MRGSNFTRKGSGCELAVSVKARLSIGEDGSCEMLKAHSRNAELMNTDRLATCCPGQTLVTSLTVGTMLQSHRKDDDTLLTGARTQS